MPPTRHSPENTASGLGRAHRVGNASFPLPRAWVEAWPSSFFLKSLAMPTIFAMAMVPRATDRPGHPVHSTEIPAVAANRGALADRP